MGIVLIPDMGSSQISVTVTMPEEDDKDIAFEKADEVMAAIAKTDARRSYIGATDAGSSAGLVGGMGVDTQDDYGSFAFSVSSERGS